MVTIEIDTWFTELAETYDRMIYVWCVRGLNVRVELEQSRH